MKGTFSGGAFSDDTDATQNGQGNLHGVTRPRRAGRVVRQPVSAYETLSPENRAKVDKFIVGYRLAKRGVSE